MEIQSKGPSTKGPADMFTGDVWFDVIAAGQPPSQLRVNVVRFSPGAHTAWHRHANGQTLHVTEGVGLVQSRGGEVTEIRPGDTIYTPPGEWHWHGAAPDTFMTHLAMWESLTEGQPGPETEWAEHAIDETGSQVTGFTAGDLVVAPFVWSDGTCDFCREGLQTSCRHGGNWARGGIDGGQGEAVRVPQAQGTLVKLPVVEDSALLPSLLSLSDVFPTGYHCAVTAGVNPRTTVTVIGDGAVGLSAVLSAKRLGAERIILMGRHKDRTDLGLEFGATDVIAERGEEGIAKVRELTGGVAPARAYIDTLLPDILDGIIEPGRVFDRTVTLDGVPAGYQAMADREALKVLIKP